MLQAKSLSVLVLLAGLGTSACSSHGLPSHGGGKRLYIEQDIVATSAMEALDKLNFSAAKGKNVKLVVTAMGDAGGGSGRGGLSGVTAAIGNLFGGSGGAGVTTNDGAVAINQEPFSYSSFSFANANDMEYLKALISEKVRFSGAKIGVRGTAQKPLDGTIHVLVHEYGTNRSSFSVIVYNEEKLRAKTRMSAYYVPFDKNGEGTPELMGEGERTILFKEGYVLGIGPVAVSTTSE